MYAVSPRLIPSRSTFSGLGYTGLAAANYFTKRGWRVTGTCRTEEKTDALRLRGFNAHTFHTDGFEQLR